MTETQKKFTAADFIVLATVGAICGGLLWLVGEGTLIAEPIKPQFAAFVISFAAGFTVLWRRELMLLRVSFILALALLLAVLTWQTFSNAANIDQTPMTFWALVGGPLLGFLMSALARASFRRRAVFWPYKALWQSGASILADAFIAGAVGLAAVAFVALWGAAFKSFGMEWAASITHSPEFLLPLGGGAAGLAGGLARSNTRLGEAVRSVLLIGCRIGLPLAALFSLVFAFGLIGGGAESLDKVPLTPAGLLLALALASELIFNGVYQDGAQKPPRWLRLSTWVALAVLPIYTVAAAAALWMRVDAYGLTPSRMIALIALTLTAAYTVLLLSGLVSEFLSKRFGTWMPPVAKLNTIMALVWVLTLILMHTPLLDPIGVSARNQEARLLKGKVSTEKFDFGFLHFKLGKPGERALARLAKNGDPDILDGIARARMAENYWDYKGVKTKRDTLKSAPSTQEKEAHIEINIMLADTGMAMKRPIDFDYGALAYAHGEDGKKAFKELEQWVENAAPDDTIGVKIMRKHIGQGMVSARLAKTLATWKSAKAAAHTSTEAFKKINADNRWNIRRLGDMAAEDQAVRELFKKRTRSAKGTPSAQAMLELLYANAVVDEMDEDNLDALKILLGNAPWFDRKKIGKFAEQDAWLIVMHADHDPKFQEAVLQALKPGALAGTFDGRRYALLFDTVARAQNKPQRYGTKSLCEDGHWVADVTQDPEHVDQRRKQMGLAPLAQTLAQENTRFGECHN